ncbi:MAG: hypothetical protein U9O24_08265 [Campylobacterota bacterium]|nr:hypothetical protein [Campylobacterota bacterium]
MKIKKLSTLTLLLSSLLLADGVDNNSTSLNLDFEREGVWSFLPYAFSSDSAGFTAGIGVIVQGLLQPHTTLVATLFGGEEQEIITNGEADTSNFSGGLIAFNNLKVPYTNRVFFSAFGYMTTNPKENIYFDSSHQSKMNDVWVTSTENNFFTATLKYVLPLGEGLNNPGGKYNLKNGFAINREGYGNRTPFVTGRTEVGLTTFYQNKTINNTQNAVYLNDAPLEWNSSGLRLFLSHNNTDYKNNPSRGYNLYARYSKDFGSGDSLQSWDFLEFKASKYFNLNTFSFTQQNVLAFNFWTAHSFSWENDNEFSPGVDMHRTPLSEGARLGGFIRMRGYNQNRFIDKSAIYASMEYRAVINYNPIKNGLFGEWIAEHVPIDWFQVVGFVEAGRVHDTYNFELLQDLKYDVGVSLRAMVAELPVRFDIAYGEEGSNMWVMIKQPFDF